MNNELKELIELANLTGPSGQEYRVARYLEPELVNMVMKLSTML